MFCFILQQRLCLAIFLEIHQTGCSSINTKKSPYASLYISATDLPEGDLKHNDFIPLDRGHTSGFLAQQCDGEQPRKNMNQTNQRLQQSQTVYDQYPLWNVLYIFMWHP